MATSSKDVRAGGAWWELYAKDGISGVLSRVQKNIQSFSGKLRSVGGMGMGLGAALGAGPLGFLFGGVSHAADAARLSAEMQVPIEQISRLKMAADLAGVSIDELAKNQWKYADAIARSTSISTEEAKNALSVQREWATSVTALQNAMLPLLEIIAPLAKQFGEFARQNAAIVQVVGLVALGIFAAGTALTLLGTGISAVSTTFSLLATIAGYLFTPAGLIVAGSIAIIALAGDWRDFGRTAVASWGGIVDAIKGGNIALAAEIAFTALKLEWAKVVLFWTDTWNGFKGIFVDGWHAAVASVALIINKLKYSVQLAFMYMGDAVLEVAANIAEAMAKIDPSTVSSNLAGGIRALQSGVGEGARDRVRRERDQAELDLMQAHSREQKARADARSADAKSAQDDINRLQAKLTELNTKAAAGVTSPIADELRRNAEFVRGSFSPFAAKQAFGYGDTVKPLLQIAENTNHLPERIGQVMGGFLQVR